MATLIVVVLRICLPVIVQHQVLSIDSLRFLVRGWRSLHVLRSSQHSNVSVGFFEFFSTKFAEFFEAAKQGQSVIIESMLSKDATK